MELTCNFVSLIVEVQGQLNQYKLWQTLSKEKILKSYCLEQPFLHLLPLKWHIHQMTVPSMTLQLQKSHYNTGTIQMSQTIKTILKSSEQGNITYNKPMYALSCCCCSIEMHSQ